MAMHPQKKNVSIQQVLTALLDENTIFPPIYLHQFSDLEGRDLEALRSVWPQVKPNRRIALMEDLEELSEADTLVSFDNVARMALQDSEPRARSTAIRLLSEIEDPKLVPVFLKMMNEDPDTDVRANAASALGMFVYIGELEEISEDLLHQVEDNLLSVLQGQDESIVRRRALEALGFSGRPEVPPLIREAYQSPDPDWLSTALFAISRSADQAWNQDVLRMLHHPKANVQLEAVRAAGELAIENARRSLLDLLEEAAQDSEIRAAVIWSLSQIGGDEVRDTLETLLEETEDEEELEHLENALDNLAFTEDQGLYSLYDFDQLGEPNREIDDLERYSTSLEDDNTTSYPLSSDDDAEEDSSDGGDAAGRGSTTGGTTGTTGRSGSPQKPHRHK